MRLVCVAVLAAGALSFAQDVTFRAGTRLVEVSVTVLDRDGKPVTGLRQEDFTVHDAGKPRPIAFLQFDGEPAKPPAQAPLPKGVFTNMVEVVGGPPRNISALVLDGLNTPPEHNIQARAQAMRYLKALAPETRVAVFHMGQKLRVLHDFTDDAESLRAKVEKARLDIPLESVTDFARSVIEAEQYVAMFPEDSPMRAQVLEEERRKLDFEMMANVAARRSRMERTLIAMEMLGQHLAGIPGRKNLVWITSGFSMVAITGEMGFGPRGGLENYEQQVRNVSRRLAHRGVVLYIVDAAGLHTRDVVAPASAQSALPLPGRGLFEKQTQAEAMNNDPAPAMTLMASVTGGRYLFDTNDLVAGLRQAVADLRGSYTIGFYAPEEGDGKWRKLQVRVARPGVRVQHRQGYFAEGSAAPQPGWSNDSWRAAVANPLGSSAVRFTAACERKPDGEVVFRIRVAAASLRFRREAGKMKAALQFMIAGRSAEGHAWTTLRDVTVDLPPEKESELQVAVVPFALNWTPDPAVETIRLILRDKASGQFGTVDVALKKLAPQETTGAERPASPTR